MTGIRLFNRDLDGEKDVCIFVCRKIRFITSYADPGITGNQKADDYAFKLLLMEKNESMSIIYNYKDVT